MECYTIRAYFLGLRPFGWSSSAGITTTRWLAILVLKRLVSCWRKNCKTVNLVVRQELLDDRRGMLSMIKRSHVIRHVLTLWIFGTSKKLYFWQNREEVFNQLNSAS